MTTLVPDPDNLPDDLFWHYQLVRFNKRKVKILEITENNDYVFGYSDPLWGHNKKEVLADLQMMFEDCKKYPLITLKMLRSRLK